MQIIESALYPCRHFFEDIGIEKKENRFLEAVWQFAVPGKEFDDEIWIEKNLPLSKYPLAWQLSP